MGPARGTIGKPPMSLGLAFAIVLGALVVLLGLVTYHLTTRISLLESAVDGGLRAPERSLTGAEYAARFANAMGRAALARELGDGIAIILNGTSAREREILDITANLATGRGITLVFGGEPSADRWPTDLTIRSNMAHAVEAAGIVATPFGMRISDGRVAEARLLGSNDSLFELLGTTERATSQPTPLEVD